MLSEQDIEAAHPEAFDFVFGNLPRDKRAEFNRHLSCCRYCQDVVDEYAEIGQVIKNLPPHVEPPADLQERTIAAMVTAMAEQRAQADQDPHSEDEAVTRLYPIPERRPPVEEETRLGRSPVDQPVPAEPHNGPVVTRLPVWRRYRGRLAAVVAAAAAAIAIPLSLLGSGAATVIPLYATAAAKVSGVGAATGQATARQDASGSWNITLTVAHLKNIGGSQWYECWYIGSKSGHLQVAPAGSFLVSDRGSRTFTMTSAVDPHEFKTMVITLQPPSADGAFQERYVILKGQTL